MLSGGISDSNATVLSGKWWKRGASPASWTFMPNSIMFSSTWTWPWGCMSPPITPNESQGLPSRNTIAGIMV